MKSYFRLDLFWQAFVTDSCAQVNSRDDVRQPITAERRQGQGWKFRLQNLFCCFAPPSNSQYYRPEPDSVIVKPPQPPTPPLHVGGDVLGPIHKQVQVLPASILPSPKSPKFPCAMPESHLQPAEIATFLIRLGTVCKTSRQGCSAC